MGERRVFPAGLVNNVRRFNGYIDVKQEFSRMKMKFYECVNKLRYDRKGATAIEYGLIAALIAVVIIAGVTLLGSDIGNKFNNVSNSLAN